MITKLGGRRNDMGTIWSNSQPQLVCVDTGNGLEAMSPEPDGSRWARGSVSVEWTLADGVWSVRMASPEQDVWHVVLRWSHQWSQAVRILNDHWERGYGDLEWRGLVPERLLPWYFMAYEDGRTDGFGVKTQSGAICFWQADSRGITLTLDVRNGVSGVSLGSRILNAATVVFRPGVEGEKPIDAARAFCRQLSHRTLTTEEPVYGSNNWYYAYGVSSHEQILADSRLVASLAPQHGPKPFMVIDDGWQPISLSGTSCNGGPWDKGNYKFPDMETLAEEMKAIGVKPGLWYRPLLTSERMPSNTIRKVNGFNGSNVLDPSVPEVLETIAADIRRFVAWGYQLIKHDFSTYDIFGLWGFEMNTTLFKYTEPFADQTKTTAEIIVKFYETIHEAAGNAVLIGCDTIGHLAAGLVHLQRTGDDTSGREWERTRKMGINTLAFRMPQHGVFFQCDADCVGITDKVPWALNCQWLKLLAESGTPLFVSADPKAMTPEIKDAVRHAFADASMFLPPAEPLDWMETTCPERWILNGEQVTFNWSHWQIFE
jgi:alpha-galactosidase